MNDKTKIEPCFVCVTQDICRDRGECVQKEAWPSNKEIDKACRWNAFVIHLHANYSYLLNYELAMQIAREAQEHFEEEEFPVAGGERRA